MIHCTRDCMALKAFEVAVEKLYGLECAKSDNPNETLEKYCRAISSRPDPSLFLIDTDQLARAVNLTEYFNKHKVILAGYDIDPDMSFEGFVKTMIDQKKNRVRPTGVFSKYNTEQIKIMHKIMLTGRMKVYPLECASHNITIIQVVDCMEILASLNLGRVTPEVALNNKTVRTFWKVAPKTIRDSRVLSDIIQNLGMSLISILAHLESIKNIPI